MAEHSGAQLDLSGDTDMKGAQAANQRSIVSADGNLAAQAVLIAAKASGLEPFKPAFLPMYKLVFPFDVMTSDSNAIGSLLRKRQGTF